MEEGRKGGKKGDFVLGILRWRPSRQREAGPGTGCAVGEALCSQERARDAGGSRRLGAFSPALHVDKRSQNRKATHLKAKKGMNSRDSERKVGGDSLTNDSQCLRVLRRKKTQYNHHTVCTHTHTHTHARMHLHSFIQVHLLFRPVRFLRKPFRKPSALPENMSIFRRLLEKAYC